MEIQLLVSKRQCVALASIGSKDLMLHAQPLRVEFNRLGDIPGREHNMVD